MSVAKLPSKHLSLYILSARYRLLIGSIADLVPRCVVAFIVAFALTGPIPNRSASRSAASLLCRSLDTNVLLAGTSSCCISACISACACCIARCPSPKPRVTLFIMRSFMHVKMDGISCRYGVSDVMSVYFRPLFCSLPRPGVSLSPCSDMTNGMGVGVCCHWVTDCRRTVLGSHGSDDLRCMCGHVLSSYCVGDRDVKYTLVPCNCNGIRKSLDALMEISCAGSKGLSQSGIPQCRIWLGLSSECLSRVP